MLAPQAVTQDGHLVFPRLIFTGQPSAAEDWLHPQQGEEVRLGRNGQHMVRPTLPAQVHVAGPTKQGHILEGLVLRPPIQEIRTSEGIVAGGRFGLVQPHQLAWIAKWQRPQQDGIDNTEYGCVGANADGEGNRRDCRKAARPQQIPDRITQVLQAGSQKLHLSDSPRFLQMAVPGLDAWERKMLAAAYH